MGRGRADSDSEDERSRKRRRGSRTSSGIQPGSIVTGVIVRFDEVKGYGFIQPDDSSEDLFFLRSEMPPEMIHCQRKDEVIQTRVEFEVQEKSDGKFRARRLSLINEAMRHRPAGKIVRFDRQKGYGFIKSPDEASDVFFLLSALPMELQDRCRAGQDITDIDVEFDVTDKDGKCRASKVFLCQQAFPSMGSSQRQGMAVGTIISFDVIKGFGFIKPGAGAEDLFVMRGELPSELRECRSREEIIDRRVEFEVKQMPDGKMRAIRCSLVAPTGVQMGMPMMMGRPSNPNYRQGKIRTFNRSKGYGFIELPTGEPDVFLLPSELPVEVKEQENVVGIEVGFEMTLNDGKPRARGVHLLGFGTQSTPSFGNGLPPPPPMGFGPYVGGPMMMGQMQMGQMMGSGGAPQSNFGTQHPPPGIRGDLRPGDVLKGRIARYSEKKGYGFLTPESLDEDIFFLREEMPLEIKDTNNMDDIIGRYVTFEVRVMPDSKLRAQRMSLTEDSSAGRAQNNEFGYPLDPNLVHEMVQFVIENGGGCDYSQFASRYPQVHQSQLKEHFDIFDMDRGIQRIELPQGHPARQNLGFDPRGSHGFSAEGQARAGFENADGPGDDEPAIPPSAGCQPFGRIKNYDPVRGFGFVNVEGFEEDIFFARKALPDAFQAKQPEQMPNLNGVQVSFELAAAADKGPRADKVTLLLQWHSLDRCWLLKRN